MPWSIDPDHPSCDEGEVAVVNDESGNLVACHESRDDAQAQIAALNANVDEAISESRDNVLDEAHISGDGTAELLLITEGQGSAGYYPREVLERDGPEVLTEGLQLYLDHPTDTEAYERPERSVRDLAGVLTEDAQFREGEEGPGLYARARVFAPFRSRIAEMAPHIGLSIRGRGEATQGELPDGSMGTIIERLTSMESVDFVTKAGRGGRILALTESDPSPEQARAYADALEAGVDVRWTVDDEDNPVTESDDPSTTEEHDMDIEEANSRIDELEGSVEELRESVDTLEAERDDARRRAERAEEALLERDARDHARTVLAGRAEDSDGNTVDVPALRESAHRRIVSQVLAADLPTDEDGDLDVDSLTESVVDAAQEEAAYLAEAAGAGSVEGFGPSNSPDEDVGEDDLAEAFKGLGLSDTAAQAAARGR